MKHWLLSRDRMTASDRSTDSSRAEVSHRVALAAVFHETNSFSPLITDRGKFAKRWYVGVELLQEFRGTRTVIGGFLDGADAAGFTTVPLFGTFATPSGPVTRDAFDAICGELEAQVARCGPVDAVFLELHGDFVADGCDDAEAHLVDIVRKRLPTLPIASVLDLHANMSRRRLSNIDILVGYRTNPHVDTYEQGVVAADLLARVLAGELRPYRAHRGLDFVAAPSMQATGDHPMRELCNEADRLQEKLGLANVTIHGGYAYSDKLYTGMGFEATGDESQRDQAESAVEAMLDLAFKLKGDFRADFLPPAAAVADAVKGPAPVAIADTGDNINGGASGDTTWLIREALAYPSTSFLGTIADPHSFDAICSSGVGGTVEVQLGGTASVRSGGPLAVKAQILGITNGEFTNMGPMSTGARVSMAGAAWIRFANCDVVVQLSPIQPNDTNLFESLGIDVRGYDVVLLKGATALRAAWSTVVSRFVDAGTTGETDALIHRIRASASDAEQVAHGR